MIRFPAPLDWGAFLSDYWQKRPLLLRGAFPDWDPRKPFGIEADDVAGLACEEFARSRLVEGGEAGPWTVRHGPFSEDTLAILPPRDWTLLVQDVEKHFEGGARLLRHFNPIPSWRLDDLMVSLAAPGGSVGPHVDQYDVFLIQAQGRRCWEIAESWNPTLRKDCELDILQDFSAEQEWVLEPGDALYLPPGIAHFGRALDSGNETLCSTWSVGMRAPSAASLVAALGEWLADQDSAKSRYQDPDLCPALPGEIDSASLERLRALLLRSLPSGERFDEFAAAFINRYSGGGDCGRDNEQSPGTGPKPTRQRLITDPWLRPVWIRRGEKALLFAGDDSWPCGIDLAVSLCSGQAFEPARQQLDKDEKVLLASWLDRGFLLPVDNSNN